MNTLTTKELNAYRAWIKNRLVAEPDEVAADMLTALQAYDATKESDRLGHALDNLKRQFQLGTVNGGGELNTPSVDTAGATYTDGTDYVVPVTDDAGGTGAVVTVDVSTGAFTNLQIIDAGNGYVNPVLGIPIEAGAGDGNAVLSCAASAITEVDTTAKIDAVIALL